MIYETELYHHGVLGQKWGVRRYQHMDGTRTALGKKHERTLGDGDSSTSTKVNRRVEKANRQAAKATYNATKAESKANNRVAKEAYKATKAESKAKDKAAKATYKAEKEKNKTPLTPEEIEARKKLIRNVGMAAAATAVVAIGAYSASKYMKSQAGRIAAKEGMEAYAKMISESGMKLTTDINTAAQRSGQSTYKAYTKNATTRDATRKVLEYLGDGNNRLSSLPTNEDLGMIRNTSTGELARKAVAAQVSNRAGAAKEAVKDQLKKYRK